MSEAVDAALGFAFERLGLHRLQAAVMPHNHASRAILQKRGFREEGYAERYLRIAGRWEDHVLYGLTLEEWRPRTAAAGAPLAAPSAAEGAASDATEAALWSIRRSC